MSKWLSTQETGQIINRLENTQRLLELFGLSIFFRSAFLANDFEPDKRWNDFIVLTDYAKQRLDQLHHAGISFQEEFEKLVLFRSYYHHELYIDYVNSDINGILLLLSDLHQTQKARWPYAYGSLLYHKFNDSNNDNRTQFLEAESVEQLLANTPQGIFQVGNILSGPLGFLRSTECRITPPTGKVLLWHCSDPGCQAVHRVTLNQHKSAFFKNLDVINRFIGDNFGPPSEWGGAILHSYRDHKWPNGRPFCDMPAVMGDCIIDGERSRLLLRCFKSHYFQSLMPLVEIKKSLKGNPEEIIEQLSQEEMHQLLLMVRDDDLVKFLDELIANKEIYIPPTELRRIKTYSFGESRDTESRISSLGIRSVSHPPIIELTATIWNTYESLGISDDLLWRLRGHESSSIRHSVIDFVRTHSPELAVRELILPTRSVIDAISEKYFFQIFQSDDEESIIRRLLWKMGFSLARYEDDYHIFRNRITEFQDAVLQLGSKITESDRAKIRSIGVNLFVSVEMFLENLICYNTWLLASDHYVNPRFQYNKDDAHNEVIRTLGSEVFSGSEKFSWDSDGSNSLGCLLAYLQTFRGWVKGLTNVDKKLVARNPSDYPFYSDDTLWVFPFRHIELWADSAPEIMTSFCDIFEKICTQLGQAELSAIRNGIDHKRDDEKFPTSDKMLACVSRIQQILDIADSNRLIPKLYWGTKIETDYKRSACCTFSDYRGMSVSLWEPSVVYDSPEMSFRVPFLIAPFDFLNQPNSILIFKVSSPSEYRKYWKNYPRRRFIPPDTELKGDEAEGFANKRNTPIE